MPMCTFSAEQFYKLGALFCSLLCLTALTVATQCPYRELCPVAQTICWTMVGLVGVLACVMMLNYWALQHVRLLKDEDLAASKRTMATWRWGLTARTCPQISRALFMLSGITVLVGLLVASGSAGSCPASPSEGHVCWFPKSAPPEPVVEFGTPCALWLVVALIGFQSRSSQKLPFLFEAVPADLPVRRSGAGCAHVCMRFCVRVAKVVHP